MIMSACRQVQRASTQTGMVAAGVPIIVSSHMLTREGNLTWNNALGLFLQNRITHTRHAWSPTTAMLSSPAVKWRIKLVEGHYERTIILDSDIYLSESIFKEKRLWGDAGKDWIHRADYRNSWRV